MMPSILESKKRTLEKRSKKQSWKLRTEKIQDSYYKLDELIAKIQESDVQVFCVGFWKKFPEKHFCTVAQDLAPKRLDDALNQISEKPGKAFFPTTCTSDIDDIVPKSPMSFAFNTALATSLPIRPVTDHFAESKSSSWIAVPRYLVCTTVRGYFAPKLGGNIPTTASKPSGRPVEKQ